MAASDARSERPRVVVLASLTGATGNAVTAARLAHLLDLCGFEAFCRDTHEFDAAAFAAWAARERLAFAVGIHAFRAGALLAPSGVPFVLVLGGTWGTGWRGEEEAVGWLGTRGWGPPPRTSSPLRPWHAGTDVNEIMLAPAASESKRAVVRAAVERARAIVAFSVPMADGLRSFAGESARVRVIPQSVALAVHAPPRGHEDCVGGAAVVDKEAEAEVDVGADVEGVVESRRRRWVSLREAAGVREDAVVFLLPAGLRPVKDPLFLAEVRSRERGGITRELWSGGGG